MQAEGVVGPVIRSDGSPGAVRLGRNGEVIVADEFDDAALRGDTFYASVAVGGVDHQASLTTTAPFALNNPPGNDVDLIVLAVTMGYVSGTLGGGFLAAAKYFEDSLKVRPSGTLCVAHWGKIPVCRFPGPFMRFRYWSLSSRSRSPGSSFAPIRSNMPSSLCAACRVSTVSL